MNKNYFKYFLCLAVFSPFAAFGAGAEQNINLSLKNNGLSARWINNGSPVNAKIEVEPDKKISKADSTITSEGNIVVVWAERLKNSNDNNIYAQIFSSDGMKLWSSKKIPINVFRGNQTSPKIARAADGGFFVVWQSDSAGKNNINIWCKRFYKNGTPAWLTPVPVCAFSGNQINPVITTDIDGSVLVAWEDYRKGNADVYGQRIEQDGSFTGPEDGALIDGSAGNQTNIKFEIDQTGQPVALSWTSQRKGFLKPVIVETDISKMPMPEPIGIIWLLGLLALRAVRLKD